MKAKIYTPLTYGRFLQLFHPIGSYFKAISTDINPNTLFPGTKWNRLSLNNALIISGSASGTHSGGNLFDVSESNIRKFDGDTADNAASEHGHKYWPLVSSLDNWGDYNIDTFKNKDVSYPESFGDNQGAHNHSMTVGVNSTTKIDLHKSFKRLYCIIWERVS